MHTISCFSNFDNICVVLPKRNFSDWTSLCKEHEFKIKHTLVEVVKTDLDLFKMDLKN